MSAESHSEERQRGVDAVQRDVGTDRSRARTTTGCSTWRTPRAYHWGEAPECRPENLARGEWLISRVYCVLGRAEPALWHARRCLEWVEEAGVGDWDLAYAYEALARASAVAGDAAAAGEWRARARQAGDAIGDPEDREHFDEDFATL